MPVIKIKCLTLGTRGGSEGVAGGGRGGCRGGQRGVHALTQVLQRGVYQGRI